jgi:hypothetical protein
MEIVQWSWRQVFGKRVDRDLGRYRYFRLAGNPFGGHSIPQSTHVYLRGANRPADIFGASRCGGANACSSGFTGGEQHVGIDCKDNASPWQAR